MKKILLTILYIFVWIVVDKEVDHGTRYILEDSNYQERIKVTNPICNEPIIVGDTVKLKSSDNVFQTNMLEIIKKRSIDIYD